MASTSNGKAGKVTYRDRLKSKDPAKYEELQERQRIYFKERRLAKKIKWETETHTREMIQEHERERELNRTITMATTVPTKIVLKSTTRMSLNDRFSNIQSTIQNIRANMAAEQQVSAANRRLAQQLANRPGLQASAASMYQPMPRGGGAMRQGNMNPAMKKKSLQQRLGKSNIKNRLSLPASGQQTRGRGRGRGGVAALSGGGGDNQWGVNRPRGRGGFSPRGPRGRGAFRARGRGTYNRFDENSRPGDFRRRGGQGGGRGRPNRMTGQNTQNQRGGMRGGARGTWRGTRGQGRGNRGNNSGGRGGSGGSGRGGKPSVSVQELDSQLDEYMARSKSHLDAELDAYMSEVTN